MIVLPIAFGSARTVNRHAFTCWVNHHTASHIESHCGGNHPWRIITPGAPREIPFNPHGQDMDVHVISEFAVLCGLPVSTLLDLIHERKRLPKGTGKKAVARGVLTEVPKRLNAGGKISLSA